MVISDKTRKVLWGRSGNRCAICKRELVIDATLQDDESVVGDECHIVSSRQNGPRYDSSYPQEKLDSCENLILLCRIHHKMVDDQEETYSADILRQMKSNHEVWVSGKLTDRPKPVKIRRLSKNIPEFLSRFTTGKQVIDLVTSCIAFYINHDEPKSQREVDLIGEFLQNVQDWADIKDLLEPSQRVNLAYSLTQSLQELEDAGFYVFGGREVQLIEGGIEPEPSNWPVGILNILRKDSKEIIQVDLDEIVNERDKQE